MSYTNIDDLLMELTANRMRIEGWGPLYALTHKYAVWQGRAYFYFSMIFFVLPFFIRSLAVRAALSALLQLGATCSIGAVVGMYAGFRNALLAVALTCAWLPYWRNYYPVNGYPFVYHLPVLLFFSGLAVWIRLTRAKRPRRVGYALCWIAFFISLFFYEALIPPFFLTALAVVTVESRRTQRPAMRALAPWLAGFGLWAAIYLGFRLLHPATYDGSALAGVGEWSSTARSLLYFEGRSLPGADWVANPAAHVTADGVVLGVLLFALLIFSAFSSAPPHLRGKFASTALVFLCAVMIPLPLAFTAKYRTLDLVRWVAPYVPGYFAFLFWAAFLALAFPLAAFALRRLPPLRWAAALLLAGVYAAIGIDNTAADNALAHELAGPDQERQTLDLLARSSWFAALPADSVFLAPDLWADFPYPGWENEDAHWNAYFSGMAGRPLRVVRRPYQAPELLRAHKPVFYCEHLWPAGRQDSIVAIEPVVKLSPAGDAVTDSVLLFSGAKPANAVVEYRALSSDAPAAVEPEWREENGAYTARLAIPGLIAGTLQATDGEAAPSLGLLFAFERGFSPAAEQGGGDYWRWSDGSDGEGELAFYNLSPRPSAVRFRASLHFNPAEKQAAFDFVTPQGRDSVVVRQGEVFERVWRLSPGVNRIRVKCHAGRVPAAGDPRYIVFGIWNWKVEEVGNQQRTVLPR